MKDKWKKTKKLYNDEKAVFGLTSVQSFFAIILSVALLAFVIVVIMGTLADNSIIPVSYQSAGVTNESAWINQTTYTLTSVTASGFASPAIVLAINDTGYFTIPAANYSLSSAGVLTNKTPVTYHKVLITYTYKYNLGTYDDSKTIANNVSTGITSFFGAINPVYSILAILVIILVLVVLVRVVTGSTQNGYRSEQASPL